MRSPAYAIAWSLLAFLAGPALETASAADSPIITEPHAGQVFQRDRNGRATIPVVLAPAEAAKVKSVELQPLGLHLEGNAFENVPTGGPYSLQILMMTDGGSALASAGPFYVGDLWVLAGQSNMEGVGDLVEVTPPNDRVMLLGMGGQWYRAEEPLHWLVDSPDPVHSGDPSTRAERAAGAHKTRRKGAGLGLPFAVSMVNATNVPIGLVACAHGGTSMEQWNPSKKDEGGNSLYGSMMRQVKLAGGKVKGVLWYQGEAEANAKSSQVFPKVFADFIGAVRQDFGQP
ncbi:MAG TPA: sialate O-acetylesterase, partial [Pirellulales bacterium]|nr:sialate O-acetylesterase [Pirellulales bacterium]